MSSNDNSSKQAALCNALALSTRHELEKDFSNLGFMITGLAADLERIRAEVSTLRKTLEAEQLQKTQDAERKAAKAAAKAAARAAARAAVKAKQAKLAPPAGEGSEDAPAPPAGEGSEDAPAPPAGAEPAPQNALLFYVSRVVDDVDGFRSELLGAYPTPMRVRTLAAAAGGRPGAGRIAALAENWTGDGSELTPADWRALARAAWKGFAKDRQDAIRAAFKAKQAPPQAQPAPPTGEGSEAAPTDTPCHPEDATPSNSF